MAGPGGGPLPPPPDPLGALPVVGPTGNCEAPRDVSPALIPSLTSGDPLSSTGVPSSAAGVSPAPPSCGVVTSGVPGPPLVGDSIPNLSVSGIAVRALPASGALLRPPSTASPAAGAVGADVVLASPPSLRHAPVGLAGGPAPSPASSRAAGGARARHALPAQAAGRVVPPAVRGRPPAPAKTGSSNPWPALPLASTAGDVGVGPLSDAPPSFVQVLLQTISPPAPPIIAHYPALTDLGEPIAFFTLDEINLS